jgi:hypothetical protein
MKSSAFFDCLQRPTNYAIDFGFETFPGKKEIASFFKKRLPGLGSEPGIF